MSFFFTKKKKNEKEVGKPWRFDRLCKRHTHHAKPGKTTLPISKSVRSVHTVFCGKYVLMESFPRFEYRLNRNGRAPAKCGFCFSFATIFSKFCQRTRNRSVLVILERTDGNIGSDRIS